VLTPAGDLRPGFSTVQECLDALARASTTWGARETFIAFVRAPDTFGRTHLYAPARRAWEEAFAAAWATEAALLEQGPWQGDMGERPPGTSAPEDAALADPPPEAYGRAPYARTLAEVAERGRASGARLSRPGRRPR